MRAALAANFLSSPCRSAARCGVEDPKASHDDRSGLRTSVSRNRARTFASGAKADLSGLFDYHPIEEIRPREGGVLNVDLPVADPRWLMRLVLHLAPYAGPPDKRCYDAVFAANTLPRQGA